MRAMLIYALATSGLAVAATTVFLHRSETHGAVRFPPWLQWVFKFILFLTTGIYTLAWVTIHRIHHAHSDEPGDPHSPRIYGFWPVQLGNAFLYRNAIRRLTPAEYDKYSRDLLDKEGWWDYCVFRHGPIGLLIGIAILCSILGLGWGLLAAGLHTVLYVFALTPSINGLCHWPHRWLGGYQNSRTAQAALTFNNWVVALVTGGEGLHNNHHDQQATARFAYVWWEYPADWGYWLIIWPLARFGLATKIRLPSKARSAPA